VLQRALDFLVRTRDRLPLHEVPQKYPLARIEDAFRDADLLSRSGKGVVRACIDLTA
jgi:hypothetical protein